MKYTLENFFEELNPNELDEIMPDNFDAKLPKKSLKRIEKNALQKSLKRVEKAALQGSEIKNDRRHFNFRLFAPVAACLVLMAGIGGLFVISADFFAQNGLSAKGLSREDLKAVYRDITINRFTSDKAVEVIKRSVPGVEILQKELTPEELSALWNSNINLSSPRPSSDVEYRIEYEYPPGEEQYEWDKITVECLRNGDTLWKTDFPTLGKEWGDDDLYVKECVMTSAGTVIWGEKSCWTDVTESSKSPGKTYGWIARIDDSGNKLWQIELDHGFGYEYIETVLDNGDGTWSVISGGDSEYLCLSQFDINGNELSFQKAKVDRMHILNAARLSDGYLVQTDRVYTYWEQDEKSNASGGCANLVKLDRNGNITDNFVYESDDCDYYITDMAEFEGNVYLSAYSVPKQTDGGGRHEIANILDYVHSGDNRDISSEELTPMVRENYTAVLILCDPNGGEPKKFYSVKSSFGGNLAVEDGQLKWNVMDIVSAYYSPCTSSFTIGGKCLVYQYSFDENSALIGCEDTGNVAGFWK